MKNTEKNNGGYIDRIVFAGIALLLLGGFAMAQIAVRYDPSNNALTEPVASDFFATNQPAITNVTGLQAALDEKVDKTGGNAENLTMTGTASSTGLTVIETLTITEQSISSSETPTWDVNAGQNATFTATNAATFTISNLAAGQTGTLAITQTNGTAGYVMTFPAGTKQAFGGTNTYTMSGTNTIDILYFRRIGTNTVIEGVVPGVTP